MKLYYAPSACSMSSHIILNEIGKKFEIEKVDLGAKKTASGKDFMKINPKGYVPALEMKKGEVLTECAVIAQYLADKAKATKILAKAGSPARYRTIEMLNFIASEIHKTIGALFNKALHADTRAATIERAGKRIDLVNGILAKNKFIMGKSFTVADAYLFTVLNWGQWVGIDMKAWKHVAAYLERMAARPSVKKTLAAEAA
jgi:glutathione S-transferase